MATVWTEEIRRALCAPFPPDEVAWKPQQINGDSAIVVAFLNARHVCRRLDAVVGPGNWIFVTKPWSLEPVVVHGSLSVLGAIREDCGQADKEDEPFKSAVSDALKRCAAQIGVGRYLYELERKRVRWDARNRRPADPVVWNPMEMARAAEIAYSDGIWTPNTESVSSAPAMPRPKPQQQARPETAAAGKAQQQSVDPGEFQRRYHARLMRAFPDLAALKDREAQRAHRAAIEGAMLAMCEPLPLERRRAMTQEEWGKMVGCLETVERDPAYRELITSNAAEMMQADAWNGS